MITLESFDKTTLPMFYYNEILAFHYFEDNDSLHPETKNLPLLPPEVRKFILEYGNHPSQTFSTTDGKVLVPGWVIPCISVFSNRMITEQPLPVSTQTVNDFLTTFERFVEGEEMTQADKDLLEQFAIGLFGKCRREIYMDFQIMKRLFTTVKSRFESSDKEINLPEIQPFEICNMVKLTKLES